jgi:hypothetical protein
MNSSALGLVASVLVTVVAIAFAWVGGKVIEWVRRHNGG